MKTRWYFIIAGAAVAGFAVWYQDFARKDTLRREAAAAEQARQRLVEIDQRREAEQRIREDALAAIATRRHEREQREREAAIAQARREEWQSQLGAVREENAALRVGRERLRREIADVEGYLTGTAHQLAAVASEDAFLLHYINAARASVDRLAAVAEKAEGLRIATSIPPEPARLAR